MKCLVPILITLPSGSKQHVSCGQCVPCRITKQESWVGRLILEQGEHKHSSFCTLTYRDDPGTLKYFEFQEFIALLRRDLPNIKFRYAVCGEYGEQNGRGHWHVIIFGLPPFKAEFPNEIWPHGFSLIGPTTKGAMRYVAGYCLKRSTQKTPDKVWQTSRNPGIGLSRIRDMADLSARATLNGAILSQWPGYFSVGKTRFPLVDGGMHAYKTAFEKAGGIPPGDNTQSELTIDFLQTDLQNKLKHKRQQTRKDPFHGKKEARKTKL